MTSVAYDKCMDVIRNKYQGYAQQLDTNAKNTFGDNFNLRAKYLYWFIEYYQMLEIGNATIPDDLGIEEFNNDAAVADSKIAVFGKKREELLRLKSDELVNNIEQFTLVGCTIPEVDCWCILNIKKNQSKKFVKD